MQQVFRACIIHKCKHVKQQPGRTGKWSSWCDNNFSFIRKKNKRIGGAATATIAVAVPIVVFAHFVMNNWYFGAIGSRVKSLHAKYAKRHFFISFFACVCELCDKVSPWNLCSAIAFYVVVMRIQTSQTIDHKQ